MTAKIGISLPDTTYDRALAAARASGTSMSGLVDEALRAELARRDLADHVAMLAEAEAPEGLEARARARSEALRHWKTAG